MTSDAQDFVPAAIGGASAPGVPGQATKPPKRKTISPAEMKARAEARAQQTHAVPPPPPPKKKEAKPVKPKPKKSKKIKKAKRVVRAKATSRNPLVRPLRKLEAELEMRLAAVRAQIKRTKKLG